MRFLMLNWRDPRNPAAGGAERVTHGYLKALVDRGHQVYWFTHHFQGAPITEMLDGIHLIREGTTANSWLKAARWCASQVRFDLVIDQHHGIPWYAPWWCRTHNISYIHEVLGPIWNAFYKWPWNLIGRTQERWTHWFYRQVPFWTACESTRNDLIKNGVRRVSIIRYGVSTMALPQLPPKSLSLPLRLIVVSRLAPNKRIGEAIKLVQELLQRKIPATLQIIGSGEEERALRILVQDYQLQKSVTFTGPLPEQDKDLALREAHFLVHTSQREGWGLNVIEANAMGTPAIVYPVPGLIESTLHQKTGVVAANETAKALADAIEQLLPVPQHYQYLREQAWMRARQFHWNRILPIASEWLEARARGDSIQGSEVLPL